MYSQFRLISLRLIEHSRIVTVLHLVLHFHQPSLSQVEDSQLLNITVTYNQQISCKIAGDIEQNLLYILKHRGSLYYLPSHQ